MQLMSRQLMIQELETARDVLNKWVQRVKDGVPGEDFHVAGDAGVGDEDPRNAEDFYNQLAAELNVVSGKCETLSVIITERA